MFPHTASMGGSGTQRAMAITYQQTSTTYSFVLEGMANRDTTDNNFFTTRAGRINFGALTVNREDLFKMIATFNRTTQAGTVHYAWMAGGGDPAARAFHVTTTGRENSSTGVGYFGYSAAIPTLSDNPGGATIWPTGMRCNWVNDMAATVAKIQKQTMTYNGTTFIPGSNNLKFRPHSSCEAAGAWTVSAAPTFLNGSHSDGVPTHELTDYAASSVPQVSPPTVTLAR